VPRPRPVSPASTTGLRSTPRCCAAWSATPAWSWSSTVPQGCRSASGALSGSLQATIIGGVICGIVAYGWLSQSTQIWEAYLSYAVLGGIGSGMVYSSCINIVAKWYPSLTDGLFRPVYGYISEFVGRRQVMYTAYALNAVFQVLALIFGMAHVGLAFAICAIISGGLSGANFPMTAAMTADYWGETNNAINYGSIYIWKALGGSFAGGLAALVMTGTLYGSEHFNWTPGFLFGATLGLLAAIVVFFRCKRPTVEDMRAAVAKAAAGAQPVAVASS
jgi:hypothetical protein